MDILMLKHYDRPVYFGGSLFSDTPISEVGVVVVVVDWGIHGVWAAGILLVFLGAPRLRRANAFMSGDVQHAE